MIRGQYRKLRRAKTCLERDSRNRSTLVRGRGETSAVISSWVSYIVVTSVSCVTITQSPSWFDVLFRHIPSVERVLEKHSVSPL